MLIKEQQLRRHHRCHEKRQRLALPAGEETNGVFHAILETHVELPELIGEEGLILLADAAEGIAVRRAQVRKRKVFFDRHVWRSAAQGVLKKPPDTAGALVLGQEGDVLLGERNAALVDIKAARDGVEEGRFARTVRADDGDEVALVQVKR